MAVSALPPGRDVHTTPGHAYAFDARVKLTHSKADLFASAAAAGLRIANYGEGPPEGAYRRVVALAFAAAPGVVPWSLPWPASMFDGSSLTAASEESAPSSAAVDALARTPTTAANVATTPIAPSASTRPAGGAWAWPVALGGLALAADLLTGEGPASSLLRRRRRR